MRRFEYDEDDPDKEEIERFLESQNEDMEQYFITPEQYKDLIEEEAALQIAKLKNTEKKINFKILLISISLLKKSFWWKFQSLNTKLSSIEKTYKVLSKLVQEEEK